MATTIDCTIPAITQALQPTTSASLKNITGAKAGLIHLAILHAPSQKAPIPTPALNLASCVPYSKIEENKKLVEQEKGGLSVGANGSEALPVAEGSSSGEKGIHQLLQEILTSCDLKNLSPTQYKNLKKSLNKELDKLEKLAIGETSYDLQQRLLLKIKEMLLRETRSNGDLIVLRTSPAEYKSHLLEKGLIKY